MTINREKLSLYLKMKLMPLAWRFMSPPQPERWIFIVGCYNSGTTLLHQLLAQHPMVGSMPNEGQFFNDVLPFGRQYGLPRLWALKPELFHLKETSEGYDTDRLKRQWAWNYNYPHRPMLIEKTILHMARTRWLQQHFPNSYFIALYRNGYAVAEGISRKEGHSLEKSIQQWTVSNQILMDDLQYIK
ncbi:MAG: sulfotransferase, partial [Bacteroidota bacterium]